MSRHLDFKTHKLEDPRLTVIELEGQIDSAKALESIEEIVAQPDVEHVAICMENVEYINSRGCGGLIALHHEVENREFHLFIVKPVGGVAKVMEQVGCHKILRIKTSIDEVIGELEE